MSAWSLRQLVERVARDVASAAARRYVCTSAPRKE